MNKSCLKIWIYILITLWSSEAITTEDYGTFHDKGNESFFEEPIEPAEPPIEQLELPPIEPILIDELNVKPTTTTSTTTTTTTPLDFYSENLTMFGYEIAHFNDTHAEVRNNLER